MNKNGMKESKVRREQERRRKDTGRERISPHQYAFPQRPSVRCHIQRGAEVSESETDLGHEIIF